MSIAQWFGARNRTERCRLTRMGDHPEVLFDERSLEGANGLTE